MKYISKSITTLTEMGVVSAGPSFVLVAFLFLIGVGHLLKRFVNHVPDWLSKFVSAWAIGVVVDPLLVLVVDVSLRNFECTQREACEEDYTSSTCHCMEGDFFKLAARMEEVEDSSRIMGYFYTLVIYAIVIIASGFCSYGYFLFIHMNGRMLDVYRRLHSIRDSFFVPHDFEVSDAELQTICNGAKRYRGNSGEQRVTTVTEYDFVDPLIPSATPDKTTHLAIFTLSLNGDRTLWRHFLQTPDGAIIEVTDDVSNKFSAETRGLERLLEASGKDGGTGPGHPGAKDGHFAGLSLPAPGGNLTILSSSSQGV